MQTPALTRRRFGIVTGTLALGGVGLTLASEPASADLTLGEFDMPDRTLKPEDGQVYRPWIVASGEWTYANLDNEAGEWGVYLLVGPPGGDGSYQAIAIDDGSASGTEGSGTFGLRGAITASGDWSASDFSVRDDGSPRTRVVPAAVMLLIRDGGGDRLVEAKVSRDVEITVKPGGATANVGAEGEVLAQLSSDDPTPTVPDA